MTIDVQDAQRRSASPLSARRPDRGGARFVVVVVLGSYIVMAAMIFGVLALAGKTPTPTIATIAVKLNDTSIGPSSRSVAAGLLDLSVLNAGTKPHELILFQTDLAPEQLPLGADGRVDEAADGVTKVFDSGDNIAVGATGDFSTAVIAGKYVLICNLPGHYQAGMRTSFTVTPSATPPTVLPVTLNDFALDPASASTPAGLTDFVVTDNGPTAHEFLIFRTDLDPGHLPLGANGRVDEEAEGLTRVLDSGDNIDVGSTKTFNGALTPGQYVLLCNLADHYKKGMYRLFTVT